MVQRLKNQPELPGLPLLFVGFLALAFVGMLRIFFEGRFRDAFYGGVGIGLGSAVVYATWRAQAAQRRFFEWLSKNAYAVSQGTAVYEGRAITRETPVRAFQVTFSVILLTVRVPCAFYVGNSFRMRIAQLVTTFFTFQFGWFGIPFGPFRTLAALSHNVRGGHLGKVGSFTGDL